MCFSNSLAKNIFYGFNLTVQVNERISMKIYLPTSVRKVYNRFANNCPMSGYSFTDKHSKLGLRQQYKQVRNRLTATAGMTGFLGAQALACASTGRTSDMAAYGILGLFTGFTARLFHSDLMKFQKFNAYKNIEKRAQKIFG